MSKNNIKTLGARSKKRQSSSRLNFKSTSNSMHGEMDFLLEVEAKIAGIRVAFYQRRYPGIKPDEIPYRPNGKVSYPKDMSDEGLDQLRLILLEA